MRQLWILVLIALALSGCQATGPNRPSEEGREGLSVHFNDPLAGLPRMDDLATQGGELARALLWLIDSARRTLDAAVYHVRSAEVIAALERACRRGVAVRLVLEAEDAQPERFPRCIDLRLDANDRLMHHKFAVVDGVQVWTGSANWTRTSFTTDTNDAVIIQDAGVARAYQVEFEQMFSSGRYGPAKRDTNEERFTVDGTRVEVYFPPSDEVRPHLIELIKGAQRSITLAVNVLTDDPLYEALLDTLDRGVEIEALWDFQSWKMCQFSEADELLNRGIGTWEAGPGLLHHKVAVIDRKTVVTGSANWSRSGMEHNDENVVVVHSEAIAERYLEHLQGLLDDARRFETSAATPPRLEVRHFDVARDAALLQWRPHALGVVERYEVCRLEHPAAHACARTLERPGWAWYAVDRAVSPGEKYYYRVRSWDGERRSGYSNLYEARVPEGIPRLTPEAAKRELKRYRGKIVTVRFAVTNAPRATDRGGHLFLNAGEDYHEDFTAFIPGCALARFSGSGLDLFGLQGQTVEVTGGLGEYHGPEIVVTGPWQIRVFAK